MRTFRRRTLAGRRGFALRSPWGGGRGNLRGGSAERSSGRVLQRRRVVRRHLQVLEREAGDVAECRGGDEAAPDRPCGSSTETRMTTRGPRRRNEADERGNVVRVRVAAVRVGLRPRFPSSRRPGSPAPPPAAGALERRRPGASRSARGRSSARRRAGGRPPRLALPDTWSTRCGSTHTPPFASAAYADAIWIGVTAMPWPIGTFPIVEPDHLSTGRTIPALSPGKSMPVASRSRIGRSMRPSRFRPSNSASVIAPTFDDRASISATDIVSVGRGSASSIVRSATSIDGASVKVVFGVTT